MNDSSNQKKAVWSLRLGLAAMFGYSGVDILLHPTAWYWAVRGLPLFVQNIINAIGIDMYLILQGASEVFFALVFLCWVWPRLTRTPVLLTNLYISLW